MVVAPWPPPSRKKRAWGNELSHDSETHLYTTTSSTTLGTTRTQYVAKQEGVVENRASRRRQANVRNCEREREREFCVSVIACCNFFFSPPRPLFSIVFLSSNYCRIKWCVLQRGNCTGLQIVQLVYQYQYDPRAITRVCALLLSSQDFHRVISTHAISWEK